MIRAVARWAGVAPSQAAIVSGAAARHKLAGIDREDALPAPAVWPAQRAKPRSRSAHAGIVIGEPEAAPAAGTGALADGPLARGLPTLRTTACPPRWSSRIGAVGPPLEALQTRTRAT